jgi:hypothetical protein
MAIIQNGSNLRYIKRANLEAEAKVVGNYYLDIIKSYGIDCDYFKVDFDFPDTLNTTLSSTIYRNIYGYDASMMDYQLSAHMIAYMEVEDDIFMLNKYGVTPETTVNFYFDIKDFASKFATQLGKTDLYYIDSAIISGNVDNYAYNLSGTLTSTIASGIFAHTLNIDPVIRIASDNPALSGDYALTTGTHDTSSAVYTHETTDYYIDYNTTFNKWMINTDDGVVQGVSTNLTGDYTMVHSSSASGVVLPGVLSGLVYWYDSGTTNEGESVHYDLSNTYAKWYDGTNWLITTVANVGAALKTYLYKATDLTVVLPSLDGLRFYDTGEDYEGETVYLDETGVYYLWQDVDSYAYISLAVGSTPNSFRSSDGIPSVDPFFGQGTYSGEVCVFALSPVETGYVIDRFVSATENGDFTGYGNWSGTLTFSSNAYSEISASINTDYSASITLSSIAYSTPNYSIPVNDDLAKYDSYVISGGSILDDSIVYNYTATLDASGNGSIIGTLSGSLDYYSLEEVSEYFHYIRPKVGDIVQIDFPGTTDNEQYEITDAYDKDLSNDGINPLLHKYIWKCAALRRTPSYENIEETENAAEEFISILKEKQYVSDKIVDQIEDYSDDVDEIYGGFDGITPNPN